MVVFALGVALAGGLVLGIYVVMPSANRLMALIWSDRTLEYRKDVAKRMKELYVDSDVPDETGVLMASTETGADDKQILDIMDALSATDLKALVTGGKRGVLGNITRSITGTLRKGGRGKK